MLKTLWSNVLAWRVLAILLCLGWLLAVGALVSWHIYIDHRDLHQMFGNLNTYGPLLEQARQQGQAQQSPRREPAPVPSPPLEK